MRRRRLRGCLRTLVSRLDGLRGAVCVPTGVRTRSRRRSPPPPPRARPRAKCEMHPTSHHLRRRHLSSQAHLLYAYACRPSSPLTMVRRQPRKRRLRVSRPTISAVNGRHDHLCAVVIASGLTASRLRVSALVEGVREALIHRMHAGVLAQRRPDPGGEASIGSGPPEAGSCRRPVIRRVFVLFVAGPCPPSGGTRPRGAASWFG